MGTWESPMENENTCCCCRCCCYETKITLEKGINSQNSEARNKGILCKEYVEHVSSRCSSAVSSQGGVKRLLALPKRFLSFQSPTGSYKDQRRLPRHDHVLKVQLLFWDSLVIGSQNIIPRSHLEV